MMMTRLQALIAAGLVTVAGTAAAAVATAGPAAAGPARVVLVSCTGHGQVRPTRYDIGCMPSSEFVAGLKWTSWRSNAFGSGVLEVNSCVPSCAQGKYVKYPILAVLWRARAWPRHQGRSYFSRLTWIYTGKRPRNGHEPAAQTFTLPSTGQP